MFERSDCCLSSTRTQISLFCMSWKSNETESSNRCHHAIMGARPAPCRGFTWWLVEQRGTHGCNSAPGTRYGIGMFYKTLRSAGGFCRPLRSPATGRKAKCEGRSGQRGSRFWVQTDDLRMPRAPCSRITTRTPHACTKYVPGT